MTPHHNRSRNPWTRLVTAARELPDDRLTSAPTGFATRVAALAFAQERRVASLLDLFAFRAVGLASLLALGSVALNYQAFVSPSGVAVAQAEDFEAGSPDDAVAIVLDLAD
jgi:hypothetical protein